MNKNFDLRENVMNDANEIFNIYVEVKTYDEPFIDEDTNEIVNIPRREIDRKTPTKEQADRASRLYKRLAEIANDMTNDELHYVNEKISNTMFDDYPFIKVLADRNDPDAVCRIAIKYYCGDEKNDIFIDYDKCKALLEKAKSLNCVDAEYELQSLFSDEDQSDTDDADDVNFTTYKIKASHDVIKAIESLLSKCLSEHGTDCLELGVFIPLQNVFSALVKSDNYDGNIRSYKASDDTIEIKTESPSNVIDAFKYALQKCFDVENIETVTDSL